MNARTRRLITRAVALGIAAFWTLFGALWAALGGGVAVGPWRVDGWWLVAPAGVAAFWVAWRMSGPGGGQQPEALELGRDPYSFLSRRP